MGENIYSAQILNCLSINSSGQLACEDCVCADSGEFISKEICNEIPQLSEILNEQLIDCVKTIFKVDNSTLISQIFTQVYGQIPFELKIQLISAYLFELEEVWEKTAQKISYLQFLLHSLLFDSKYTIFSHKTQNQWINNLRNKMIDIFAQIPTLLLHILKSSPNSIITSEFLIRIEYRHSELLANSIYTFQDIRFLIATLHNIQNFDIESAIKVEAFKSIFCFILSLLQKKEKSSFLMKSKDFVEGFFSFLLSPNLSGSIGKVICQSLMVLGPESSPKNSLQFLQTIIKACIERHGKPTTGRSSPTCTYDKLGAYIISIVSKSSIENPLLLPHVVDFYQEAWTFVRLYPSPNLIDDLFSVMDLFYKYVPKYYLKIKLISEISKSIKANEGKEPSDRIYAKIIQIMSNKLEAVPKYQIIRPSLVLLLLGTFGESSKIHRIFGELKNLTDFSPLNSALMHDFDVDSFLLSRLSSNCPQFEFKGGDFVLDIHPEWCYQLLGNIILVKTDTSIVGQIKQAIEKSGDVVNFMHFINNTIIKSYQMPKYTYTMGHHPIVSIEGISSDIFNTEFSVSTFVYLISDDPDSFKPSGDLFRIASENGVFAVTIDGMNGKLILEFENDLFENSVCVFHPIPTRPFKLDLDFKSNNEVDEEGCSHFKVVIQPSLDNQQINSIEIEILPLVGDCSFVVGSVENRIEGFVQEFILKTDNQTIYSLDQDKTKAKNTVTEEENQLIINQTGQKISRRFVSYFDDIDVIIQSLKTAENFGIDFLYTVFDLIALLIKQIKIQKVFDITMDIARFLYHHPHMINYSIFKSSMIIFNSAVLSRTKKDLLNDLVLNMWIWLQAPPQDLLKILRDIHSCVIFQCTENVAENLIQTLSNQFSQVLPEAESLHEFPFTHSTEEVKVSIRESFFSLLSAIMQITCGVDDVNILITHYLASNAQSSRLYFLRLLLQCSSSSHGLDINAMLGFVIPDLKSSNFENVAAAIAFCAVHINNGFSPMVSVLLERIAKHADRSKLCNRLIQYMVQFPNLIHIVSLIALKLQVSKENNIICEFTEAIAKIMVVQKDSEIETVQLWFAFPILLAFIADPPQQTIIGKLIKRLLGRASPNDVKSIFCLCDLLSANSLKNTSSVTLELIKSLPQDLKSFRPLAMSTLFAQLNLRHSEILIDAIRCSPFSESQYNLNDDTIAAISAESYHELLSMPNSNIHRNLIIKLDKNQNWINTAKAEDILNILKTIDPNDSLGDVKAILEFYSKPPESSEIFSKQKYDMLKYINGIADRIVKQVDSYFDPIKRDLNNQIIKVLDFANQMMETKEMSNGGHKDTAQKFIAEDLERTAIGKQPAKEKQWLVRDRTSCVFLCPMKLKAKTNQSNNMVRIQNGSGDLECQLIKPQGSLQFWFSITETHVVLLRQTKKKMIRLDEILMILTRRIDMKEVGIEIFTNAGKTYLLKFKIESDNVIKMFFNHDCPRCRILQSETSMTEFARLGLIQRWSEGTASNFEFLVKINVFAGRSFNNPTLYPIFPPVLQSFDDYSANEINKGTISFAAGEQKGLKRALCINSAQESDNFDREGDIAEILDGRGFLPPEFFFLANVISENEVPFWADNRHDFVYRMRKLLESPSISRQIGLWVDRIFGSMTKVTDKPHRQIFQKQLPPRASIVETNTPAPIFNLRSPKPIAFAAEIAAGGKSRTILVVLDDGSVATAVVSFSPPEYSGVQNDPRDQRNPMPGLATFVAKDGTVVGIDVVRQECTIIASRGEQRTERIPVQYPAAACGSDMFIFAADKATVCGFSFEEGLFGGVRISSQICAFDISTRFKLAVVAAEDGSVLFYKVQKPFKLCNRAALEKPLAEVHITNSIGLIVGLSPGRVSVLSHDGTLLKEVSVPFEVEATWQFSTWSGFDYFVMLCDDGWLRCFEAMYPEKMNDILNAEAEVKLVSYDSHFCTFYILFENGSLQFAHMSL